MFWVGNIFNPLEAIHESDVNTTMLGLAESNQSGRMYDVTLLSYCGSEGRVVQTRRQIPQCSLSPCVLVDTTACRMDFRSLDGSEGSFSSHKRRYFIGVCLFRSSSS